MKNTRGIAHLYVLLAVLVVVVVFVVGKNFNKNGLASFSFIRGDSTVPDDKPDKGLVYKGLQRDKDKCKNGFKFSVNGNDKCTHGPDEVPSTMNFAQIVAPGSGNTNGVTTTTVTCDGDGTSGNRFQAIYAHGSDVASKYDTYLTSFQTWISGADADYANSAIRSGGSAIHPRFVHDSTCHPVIDNVTLPGTGSITMGDMESQLINLGYNRSDRKYVVFMDNTTYCGIADVGYDDTLSSSNLNNSGAMFARTDNTCWSDYVSAHESMHIIGAVQLTAPHSALEFHSYDTYDIMSRPTNGTPTQFVCTNTADAYMFDCNHDDYFSANVSSSSSYLATHWNTASSKFLINSYPIPSSIDQLQTFNKSGKNLVATDSF
ncbi:hypothetical protein HY045_03495, partial [Candidatus Woesebacteria bacterium]|nr:hypothetical protein [Candidatus Woesebacteria bacterium]